MSITTKTSQTNKNAEFQNPIIDELHAVREQLWQLAGENYATAIAHAHEDTKEISATMRHIQSQPRQVTGWRASLAA